MMANHLLQHIHAGLDHIYRHILIRLMGLIDITGAHYYSIHSQFLQERAFSSKCYADARVTSEFLSGSQ